MSLARRASTGPARGWPRSRALAPAGGGRIAVPAPLQAAAPRLLAVPHAPPAHPQFTPRLPRPPSGWAHYPVQERRQARGAPQRAPRRPQPRGAPQQRPARRQAPGRQWEAGADAMAAPGLLAGLFALGNILSATGIVFANKTGEAGRATRWAPGRAASPPPRPSPAAWRCPTVPGGNARGGGGVGGPGRRAAAGRRCRCLPPLGLRSAPRSPVCSPGAVFAIFEFKFTSRSPSSTR